ncbi:unnamed protein product, partial [Meganyctiphanes norvegica]
CCTITTMKIVILAILACLVAAQDYDTNYFPFSYYTYFPYSSGYDQQPQEPLYEYEGSFEPLNLPSGASFMLGDISSSFSCSDRPYGYYADVDNFCRVYHICNPQEFADGTVQTYQYSFMCGEGTVFDQRMQTCEREHMATPCSDAPNYYFINAQYGLPHEKQ